MPVPRRLKVDESFWEKIDSEEKAYFLGLMYSDGYNSVNGNYFAISLQASDVDILEKFKQALKSEAPIFDRKASNIGKSPVKGLQICSKKMCQDLAARGCGQAKGDLIRFPFWLNVELWPHFVRGYFDGDGGLSTGKTVRGHTPYRANVVSNPAFVDDLNEVCARVLGRKYYVLRYRGHKKTTQLRIEGNVQVLGFLEWMYRDAKVWLNRKYSTYLELKNYAPKQRKRVFVYTKSNMVLIGEFASYFKAAKFLGLCPETVSNNMCGKHTNPTYIFASESIKASHGKAA